MHMGDGAGQLRISYFYLQIFRSCDSLCVCLLFSYPFSSLLILTFSVFLNFSLSALLQERCLTTWLHTEE